MAGTQFDVALAAAIGRDPGDLPLRSTKAEWNDFDRQGKLPEHVDAFAAVGDDHDAFGCDGHDFFAQQRAAAALDEP